MCEDHLEKHKSDRCTMTTSKNIKNDQCAKKSDLHKKKPVMARDTRQNMSKAHELKKLDPYQKKLAT